MATVQGVYLALFGRPADAGGLAYWNGVTKAGADLSAMLKELPALPEYTSRFTNMSNEQIVKSIYQALFGRDPEAKGLADFTAALNNKTQTISSIAVNILDGAQGTDKARIDAKLAASDIFTAHLDLPAEQTAYNANTLQIAKDYLAGVTESTPGTGATADVAIAKMVAQPQGGGTPVGDDAGPNGAPVFSSGSIANIEEHSAANSTVYTGIAKDDNAGAVTYSLVGTDAGKFSINGTTGVVTINASPDFETISSYNIGVRATDSTGFASTKGVVVNIGDIVETATGANDIIAWASLSTGQSVNGLGGSDTITGGSGADTIDGGDTLTLTPVAGSNGTPETIVFTISGNNGWQWNPPNNGTRNIDVTVPGNGNDFSFTYGANDRDSASEIATLLNAQLNGISGYSSSSVVNGNSITFTLTSATVGDKANGFAVSNDGNAATVNVTNGTAAVAPSVAVSNLASANDTLTGGAGNDTFVIKASSTFATDWIKDFSAGDKIQLEGSGFTLVANYGGQAGTLNDWINNFLGTNANWAANDAKEAVTFSVGGERYLLVNGDGNGTFNAGLDQLVKITGSTHNFVSADLI